MYILISEATWCSHLLIQMRRRTQAGRDAGEEKWSSDDNEKEAEERQRDENVEM